MFYACLPPAIAHKRVVFEAAELTPPLSLLVAYCLARYLAGARPLANSLEESASDSFFGPHVGRSLWDIVKSCLVTILACTWVSTHKNVLRPRSPWYISTGTRAWYTVSALITPELVAGQAARQYFAALNLMKDLEAARRKRECDLMGETRASPVFETSGDECRALVLDTTTTTLPDASTAGCDTGAPALAYDSDSGMAALFVLLFSCAHCKHSLDSAAFFFRDHGRILPS